MFGSRLILFGSDSITSGAVSLREEFCSVYNFFFGAMVDNNVDNRKTLVEETKYRYYGGAQDVTDRRTERTSIEGILV